MHKNFRTKGFTLIEVIVVIVIIAILAAIAVPSLTRYLAQAEQREVQATAHNIQLIFNAEKATYYNIPFASGVAADHTVLAYPEDAPNDGFLDAGTTYLDILAQNGVYLPNPSVLQNIHWNYHVTGYEMLIGFEYITKNWAIVYDYDKGGFSAPINMKDYHDHEFWDNWG